MTTLGVLLLLCIGAYVCASLVGEAWLRFFPPPVEPPLERKFPCVNGCGAWINAVVFKTEGGPCYGCQLVEVMFEQMAKGTRAQ